MKYGLESDFDIEQHKSTFINYLEVVIDEQGEIHYAVPSHQEKLIAVACNKNNISREQLNDMCPQEYYCDFLNWILQITGYLSVWNDFYAGNPNENQIKSINLLVKNGLLKNRKI